MPGGEELSEILSLNMKLDELESKLSSGDNSKESVMGAIDEAQGSILPMRLKFNDFLQTMSSIDKMQEVGPDEKFLLIRSKLLELTNSMQQVSEEFTKLQPLFDTVPEYAERYGNKRFLPLETLRSATNGNGSAFPAQQLNQQSQQNLPLPQSQQSLVDSQQIQTQQQLQQQQLQLQQQQQQFNGGSASTINSAQSRKKSKSNAGTPGSGVNTPSGGITINNATPSSKKPRKPRQPKKTPSGLNIGMGMGSVPTPIMSSSNFKPQNVQSPAIGGASVMSAPSGAGNGNGSNSIQSVNGVPPTSTMGTPMNNVMSPLANAPSGFGLPQSHPPQPLPQQLSQQLSQQLTQQRQQQVQQQRQQQAQAQAQAHVQAQAQQQQQQQQQQYGMGPRSGQLPQAQINMNTITPANILSMNMAADNQQNWGNRAGKDLDPLDINNLDFGNLNMDFI
ncbi:hypothetical protein ZYGR_0AY01690 [Zygosaccharomyces rouxii]|uniref:Mediator of RNA polymerase II transcription subunit 3 n=1 Tax=Zygosaccharomyces rouxii TaxID=4956 RepID=A0A1Q3AJ62_ZYGRO|nr:hypothetical protein ZYGR_0AY01690 [Zygosaccharomyces rouxii]